MLRYAFYGALILSVSFLSYSEGQEYDIDCNDFDKESDSHYKCLLAEEIASSDDNNYTLIKILADFIRLVVRVTRPYSDIVLDLIYSVWIGPTKELPPIDNKILLMSATELGKKIRKREISSEEVVQTYIDRQKSIQPMINAVVDERYEDALNEARDVDSFLAETDKSEEEIAKETPLLGLPFTCKEGIGVKGLSNTWGLVRAKDHKAAFDADTTALYRNAGAIPISVTNVPELLMWWETANKVYGMTRNPYDNRRTVGGSSGGEGTIITSAGSLFGIGNDVAGSIRIPASFTGIYGHKPSKDVVSNKGDSPVSFYPTDRTIEFVSTGPMCRYAEDLPLLLKVLSNYTEKVPFDQKVDFREVTIYYMEEFPGYLQAAVPVVKNAIKKAVQHFEDVYGNKAIKLKIDELFYAHSMWESKLLEYGNPPFRKLMAGKGNTINLRLELVKNLLGHSNHTLPAIYLGMVDRQDKDADYYRYLQLYQELERKINDTLEGKNAMLFVPTHPEPPPHYLMTIPKYPNIGYTDIFSILGVASTSIPAGLSDNGLPFGIQAISGRFQDHLSLAAAVELDKVFKGWQSPCPVTV